MWPSSARHPAAREEKRAQEVEVFVTKWRVGLIGRGWAGAGARFQVLSRRPYRLRSSFQVMEGDLEEPASG